MSRIATDQNSVVIGDDAVKEIDQEVQYELLTENDTLLVELYKKREPLILKRNSLVDKPFFLLRRSLRKQVEKIDEQLDPIDLEIWKHRKNQKRLSDI